MIRGECFCGEVRYEIDGALVGARACHCSRCRKAFSGASSAYADLVDPKQFRWVAGETLLTRYESLAGWGLAFCSRCGSTLCGSFKGEVRGITLGTVNGDPAVEIGAHIFVESKAPWDHIGGPAPQYAEWPPQA